MYNNYSNNNLDFCGGNAVFCGGNAVFLWWQCCILVLRR